MQSNLDDARLSCPPFQDEPQISRVLLGSRLTNDISWLPPNREDGNAFRSSSIENSWFVALSRVKIVRGLHKHTRIFGWAQQGRLTASLEYIYLVFNDGLQARKSWHRKTIYTASKFLYY